MSLTYILLELPTVLSILSPLMNMDYGYNAFGDVAHFLYCLLQNIKKNSVFLLVEKWEEYMAPNESKFAAIDDEHLLNATRVLVALEKVGMFYLKKEFRRNCRNFLEDSVNCVLSTVAARSAIGHGLIYFCPGYWLAETIMLLCNFLKCCLMDSSKILVEWRWERGLQVQIPVDCARAEAAGADFNGESPWRRKRPEFLLFTGWFSCAAPSV